MNIAKTGQLISQARKERGMTQQQLAEQLNITAAAVSKWERGHSFPDISILEMLADTLDVSVIDLIRGEKETGDFISISDAENSVREAINLVMVDLEKSHVPEPIRRLFAPQNYPKAFSIVLGIVGFLLAATGGILAIVIQHSEGMGLFKGGIIILLIALLLWIWSKAIIFNNKRLSQKGIKVNATATKVGQKYTMDMPFQKNTHPYYIDFQYSVDGHTYKGRSPLIWDYPELTSKNIEIYVNPKRPKQYYMDLALLVKN